MRTLPLALVVPGLVLATSCRRDAPTSNEATASAEPAPPAAPVVVFAGQPIVLRDVVVGYERDDLMVRLKVDVPEKREGRVQIPFRASCVAGDLRVVHLGQVISVNAKRFDLARTGVGDAFVERGIDEGGKRPDACELVFRIAPIGAAKNVVEAREETLCWKDGRVVAGSCGFPPPSIPKAPFVVHDLVAEVNENAADVRLNVQIRETPKTPIDVWADFDCKGGGTARSSRSLPRSDYFSLLPGDTVALHVFGSKVTGPMRGPCTITLHAGPFTEEVPVDPPADLGTFCDDDASPSWSKTRPGACPG